MIKDYMQLPIHERPHFYRYMWMSKALSTPECLVILYGAYNAGIIGPEFNGIAVFDVDGNLIRDGIGKETSGYYGPTKKQLFIFDAIANMGPEELHTWVYNDGCVDINWQLPKRCPKCGAALECDVSLAFRGMPLYVNASGGLDWDTDEANNTEAIGFDYIYCPTCDEEVKLD